MTRWIALIAMLAVLLVGCVHRGRADQPIPQIAAPARVTSPESPLVIVLPGRWDSAESMQDAGLVDAIQRAWPQAGVRLLGATLGYYLAGNLPQRLRDEVVAPARAAGHRTIWLMGASMGGMGALLYDRAYPDDVDGIVLLAPFLGDRKLLREIAQAGGVGHWQPGPRQALGRSTYQRELWRHIAAWGQRPQSAARVWVGYGDADRLRDAIPLLTPVLREAQVLERPGGHAWSVWVPLAEEILAASRTRDGTAGRVP